MSSNQPMNGLPGSISPTEAAQVAEILRASAEEFLIKADRLHKEIVTIMDKNDRTLAYVEKCVRLLLDTEALKQTN